MPCIQAIISLSIRKIISEKGSFHTICSGLQHNALDIEFLEFSLEQKQNNKQANIINDDINNIIDNNKCNICNIYKTFVRL